MSTVRFASVPLGRSEVRQRAGQTVQSSLLEYLHACPICDHTDLRQYCRSPSLFNDGEFIRYERCVECGVVFRNPRLPPATRLERYAESVPSEDWRRVDQNELTHYHFMVRVLWRSCPSGGGRRLLDFGCGAGGFLLEARAAGFDVMGLELNRAMATYVAETSGIPVFLGLLSDPRFENERFNIVASFQVFEHLVDPRATLVEIRKHLVPPGFVLVEVPN